MSQFALFAKQQQQNNNGANSNSNTLKSSGHHQNRNQTTTSTTPNQQQTAFSNFKIIDDAAKKKALSMDSINAVERELDEVLKDLELNSQDLNDQLNKNFNNNNSNNNHLSSVELPITIQKTIKLGASNELNSPNSPSSKKWSNNGCKTPTNFALTSEFLLSQNQNSNNNNNSPLFIDDSVDNKCLPNEDLQQQQQQQASRKQQRQNVVSTYELCHECFDNNSMMISNSGEHKCKNKVHSGNNFSNGPKTSTTSNVTTATSFYNNLTSASMRQPPAYNASSLSNQDLSSSSSTTTTAPVSFNQFSSGSDIFQPLSGSNRSRSVLAQINESVAHDNLNNGSNRQQQQPPQHHHQSFSYLRSSSGNGRGSNSGPVNSNGGNLNGVTNNVISQKIVSIGMPSSFQAANGNSPRTLSPSPKLTEFKSEFEKIFFNYYIIFFI